MNLHHTVVQRLSFAKYLYTIAVEQSHLSDIQATASLLTFHDSVEFFLQIAAEQLNAGKGQPNFLDYWDILSPKLQSAELPQKESMRRLNKARVALKHSGTLPARLEIEAFRASATEFFTEACRLIFDLEFFEISLIEYVSDAEVKSHLQNAMEFAKQRAFKEAAQEVAVAYEKLIDTYMSDAASSHSRFAYSFGESMQFMSASQLGLRGEGLHRVGDFIDATGESIRALQDAVRILALGFNYKKYIKFRSRLPVVMRTAMSRNYISQWMREAEIDLEYIDYCIMFVVECAIRLDESTDIATAG